MKSGQKQRLDVELLRRNITRSRSQALDLIRRGKVRIAGTVVTKPSFSVSQETPIDLFATDTEYVSRGALKLRAALKAFAVEPKGRHCLDIGASTGGFTQVLLQEGASQVVAVDTGHGQLHEDLTSDGRVNNLERTDARHLTLDKIGTPAAALTVDVSFVSLLKILPPLLEKSRGLMTEDAWAVALIKPQFEVGPDKVGKGGIVRSADDRRAAVEVVCNWLEEQSGWHLMGTISSPLEGRGGNKEFFVGARRIG